MLKKEFPRLLGLCLLLTVLQLALTGCIAPPSGPWTKFKPSPKLAPDATRPERNLRVFDSTWDAVNTLYYDSKFNGVDWRAARDRHRPAAEAAADDEQLYRAINAMAGELQDSHTHAISPRTVREQREHRAVHLGLGFSMIVGSPEKLIVTRVWPGGPGAETDIKPGWILETCDDRPARPFLESGPMQEGQSVRCAFLDGKDQPCERTLIARPVSLPPVREARVLAHGVVYLRFDEFKHGSLKWLMARLRTHAQAPGIILDLRQNGGGYEKILEYVAGDFLPRSSPLGTFLAHGTPYALKTRRLWHAGRYFWIDDLRKGQAYGGPLAVLISNSTGSAAEIFSDAIRHHQRGVLIGTKTAGAVLCAWDVRLPDGGKLSVSIQDYRSPGERRLEGTGVEPDIEVRRTYDKLRAGIDQDIEAALVALREPPDKPLPEETSPPNLTPAKAASN